MTDPKRGSGTSEPSFTQCHSDSSVAAVLEAISDAMADGVSDVCLLETVSTKLPEEGGPEPEILRHFRRMAERRETAFRP